MSRMELDRIRSLSPAAKSGPWVNHFDEMCKKTVVRRLVKYLPLSVELAQALAVEDRAESGEEYEILDVDAEAVPEQPTQSSKVGDKLGKGKGKDKPKPATKSDQAKETNRHEALGILKELNIKDGNLSNLLSTRYKDAEGKPILLSGLLNAEQVEDLLNHARDLKAKKEGEAG